jgi:hypothetical protein
MSIPADQNLETQDLHAQKKCIDGHDGKRASRQNTRKPQSQTGTNTSRTAHTKAKHSRHVKRKPSSRPGRSNTRRESRSPKPSHAPSNKSSHQPSKRTNKDRPRSVPFPSAHHGGLPLSRTALAVHILKFNSPRNNTVPYRYPSA